MYRPSSRGPPPTCFWVEGLDCLLPGPRSPAPSPQREIGGLLPNNQRQRHTCYALCHILYLVSAAHMSIFRMD